MGLQPISIADAIENPNLDINYQCKLNGGLREVSQPRNAVVAQAGGPIPIL